jgi:hypothetical protein
MCCKGERQHLTVGIYTALSPATLRQERGKRPALLAVGKLLAVGHHQRRQLHYTRLTSTLSSFYTRASHGRAHLWHIRCRHRAYGHWTLYVWGVKELGWRGSRANEGRRHAVQWRRRGIQRTDTAMRTSRSGSDTVTTGWRVHRGYFALRLGLRRHRPLYRPVRCWSRMVRITDMKERRGSAI